jgi:hypothetical protein
MARTTPRTVTHCRACGTQLVSAEEEDFRAQMFTDDPEAHNLILSLECPVCFTSRTSHGGYSYGVDRGPVNGYLLGFKRNPVHDGGPAFSLPILPAEAQAADAERDQAPEPEPEPRRRIIM